ncbi:hypothetical protein D9M68_833780 [compost metagenome]
MGERVQAVAAWQQDVHEDQIEVFLAGQPQALLAVVAERDIEATTTQVVVQMGCQQGIVLDGKDASGGTGCDLHENNLQMRKITVCELWQNCRKIPIQ